MNFLLDHNLPPALARALNELSKVHEHGVFPLKDKFPQNTSDITWISALREEGGWVVISQDRFKKGHAEKKAFRDCALPVFCLAKHWSGESYWSKAHNLVRWWPAIMQQAELIRGGAAFSVPWRFSAPGKFEQIKL
ncbi:hypothetical protein [Pseudomonas orientalis]|uniref:Uncharacterized protein n=1 Tax=Pseudomonas orientalis TaxID=76758 RepID=A0A0R2ZT01_9PSED|nr:hypothetical protein [Pseudomonas orientalis]AZE91346.1 hypothetical protein C4J97_4684 [Pseudomonas orientalis]KRP63957.1 hypothetical protein TU82_20220 [Pseudomonas orientalis]SDU10094.1 hypothetical protein SAMN04490197_2831 [Pseudomonas orientalis]